MYNRRSSVRQSGQSLLELVVVIAVMVVVIGALTFATIASLRNAQFSKNQAQATKLAQEGLEWARTGRDRNECISNLTFATVNSWNGNSTNASCSGAAAIWSYHISGSGAGNCNYELQTPPTSEKCYFNVSSNGFLTSIGRSPTFPKTLAEGIPPSPETPIFRRAITLSDDLNDNYNFTDDDYKCAKKVTSIVLWHDFSGEHSSTLTTILRNLNPPAICS